MLEPYPMLAGFFIFVIWILLIKSCADSKHVHELQDFYVNEGICVSVCQVKEGPEGDGIKDGGVRGC